MEVSRDVGTVEHGGENHVQLALCTSDRDIEDAPVFLDVYGVALGSRKLWRSWGDAGKVVQCWGFRHAINVFAAYNVSTTKRVHRKDMGNGGYL